MNIRQRQKISIAGSFLVHTLAFLAISFAGVFNITSAQQEEIVEVAFFGGGGGGGGGAGDAEEIEGGPAETEAVEDLEETPREEVLERDAIHEDAAEATRQTPKPQPKAKRHAAGGSGGGTGGGHGSGRGTGTGSGIGPGSGSGSGGGSGSGYGSGIGSGIGPGSGVYSQPAVPPRIVRNPQPVYPAAERNAGIGGTAVLRLLVDTKGNVEDVTLMSSSGSASLDQAASSACYRWKFTSAKNKSGQNIRCYLSVSITFRMKK